MAVGRWVRAGWCGFVLRRPRTLLDWALVTASSRVADWQDHHGIEIGAVTAPGFDEELCRRRVRQSLDLIATHAPEYLLRSGGTRRAC